MEVWNSYCYRPKLTHFRIEKYVHFKTLYNWWPPYAKQNHKSPKLTWSESLNIDGESFMFIFKTQRCKTLTGNHLCLYLKLNVASAHIF